MLSVLLVIAGVLAGVTGTWSPCGLSAIDTLAGWGAARNGAALLRAGAAFALGALLGGALTFGTLALLGALLPAGARPAAALLAAGLAVAAAAADLSGVRIRPQIRRQVPEPWRRRLTPSLAAAGYGVLLGLGFTTYVLSFALWGLAGVDVLLGRPALGLALGLAFGAGRALPVLAIAPIARRPAGARMTAAMSERPGLLLALRALGALALAACALALAAGPASAAIRVVPDATDPSYAAGELAWEQPGVGAFWHHAGVTTRLAGHDPAIGGAYLAVHDGDAVTVSVRATSAPVLSLQVTGAQKLAVSDQWLAVRTATLRGQAIVLIPLAGGRARVAARVTRPTQLSRPALSGQRLAFARSGRSASVIVVRDLAHGTSRTVRRGGLGQVLNPDIVGKRLLYVRLSACRQELREGLIGGHAHDRTLIALGPLGRRDAGREHGHTRQGSAPSHCAPARAADGRQLWTTALTRRAAFVTLMRPGADGVAGAVQIRLVGT